MVAPCPVRCVQTDNGSEFAGEFEDFLRESTRKRLCRAIPENSSTDIDEFNKQMMLFLLWYNASRPHTGLNRDSPLEFMFKQYRKSPMESQML